MPYTPDATLVTQPADTGVAASTAAAEFRTLKLYLRDVILAGLAAKRASTDYTFAGSCTFLAGLVSSTSIQANSYNCATGSGYLGASGFAAGTTTVGLAAPSGTSIGWGAIAATVTQLTNLNTNVTIDAWNGNIVTAGDGVSGTFYTFVVNNNKVTANSLVVAHQVAGVAKQFNVDVCNVQAGQFTLRLECQAGLGGSTFVGTIGFAVLTRG